MPETLTKPRRLHQDAFRALVASGASMLACLVVMTVLQYRRPGAAGMDHLWQAVMASWVAFAAIHTLLTLIAFGGRSGDDLRHVLQQERREGRLARWLRARPLLRLLTVGGDAPSWAIELAGCALVVVGVLSFTSLRHEPLLLALGGTLIVVTWINVLVVFAVNYARSNLTRGGMAYPGDGGTHFSDYIHFSAMVQTTFGTTDVEITGRSVRNTITWHGLLAFAYNTFIVAMFISLLLAQ